MCRRWQGVSDYFAQLPGVDNPEIFGMHENANVTFNTNESLGLMQTVRYSIFLSNAGVCISAQRALRGGGSCTFMRIFTTENHNRTGASVLGRVRSTTHKEQVVRSLA